MDLTWTDRVLLEVVSGKSPWKLPVRVLASTPIALVGFPEIDDVQLGPGDDVLVTNQDDGTQNGIYRIPLVVTERWARRADFDSDDDIKRMSAIGVVEGSDYANSVWILANVNPITLGVSSLGFIPLGGNGDGGGGGAQFDVVEVEEDFSVPSGGGANGKFYQLSAAAAEKTISLTADASAGVAFCMAVTGGASLTLHPSGGGVTLRGLGEDLVLSTAYSTATVTHLGGGVWLAEGLFD